MARVDVVAWRRHEVVEEEDVTLARCRELVRDYNVTWVNIVDPDEGILKELETVWEFHPLTLEDAFATDQDPKVESYDVYLFIVARRILWEADIDTDQLSLWLGKKFVVTMHDKVFPQLEEVRVRIRKGAPRLIKGGPDYVCYRILDAIVDAYAPHLDRMEEIIESLESRVVKEPSGALLETIQEIRSDLLLLRRALRPQLNTFAVLARVELPLFKKETRTYLRDVYDHMQRTIDLLDTYRELTTGLMDVYFYAVSQSTNEVMKVLTLIATIMLPLTLIASLYGMNVALPFADHPAAFWIVSALMVALTGGMTIYFRRRGWV
jgi:magnesium transporter